MTDAPETIWALRHGLWIDRPEGYHPLPIKYRRADLPATDTQALANAKVQALVEAEPMTQEWQPIETAPKDGTWIMLFGPDVPSDLSATPDLTHWIAQWNCLTFDWTDQDDCLVVSETDITHWMPLPAPPLTKDNPND